MTQTVLILPGLFNSGDGHWQTLWEKTLPNARRVQQTEWSKPDRLDWVATLDAAIAASEGPVLLAAHSLGCALTAWWASDRAHAPHAAKVRGALLVAPPDVEREDFPAFVTGFAPMPRTSLPFPAKVIASSNDPWCALPRARDWAEAWGAGFHEIGARGHINGDSGLGDWPQGREWLEKLEELAH
ncbi:alpha/beta hydrolase [Noviherbaspirillum sp. CPCC 100848]|uniref:Alpha/beta hydrolase n=1 Tax=Noviherbaspirillum album TaxID=3080276 RepID=A0ABU6JB47_9BURK|nr:alpha/beta hydrolase [Noviherbaspirillum sp. CPCC 100848]MEC4720663.1 alpha/beta hydrolase [Noviherbaspirillum sp. CPCC 100848]